MNSSREIHVGEMSKILREINNCKETATFTLDDGSIEEIGPCSMQCMCDKCIDRIAGLLEWAEDFDEDAVTQPPNCS